MAFGPMMQLKVGELNIELAPITKESLGQFVSPGMQQASVIQYLGNMTAPTIEDEVEWFEKTRADKEGLTWGIWDATGSDRRLIGTTSLTDITKGHIRQATSGSMISNKEYWGKGIASAIHKARTWYAFQHLGLTRIKSAVIRGNVASRKALEKSGYALVYVERNVSFIDGKLRHQDNMECLNPTDSEWSIWWGEETPTSAAITCRELTRETMKWADQNVSLL
jgi:RimJ/RimL family protein N-acetyltransferase